MIPSEIGYFEKKSGENDMFVALSHLPNDYFVFHSYRVRQLLDGGLNDGEADFLVFNPKYGCLFIEAKNGHVRRTEDGNWEYSSGARMKDPFDQACTTMYAVISKFNETFKGTKWERYISDCKFLYCVWFPAYSNQQISEANFGPNVVKDLIMPREALTDPLAYVEAMMQKIQKMHVVIKEPEIITDGKSYKHNLTEEQSFEFLNHVLCPSFDIVPGMKKKYAEETYEKLLEEQCVVLDFLANQKSAAISGASGTGKTFVAIERAKRLADKGEKVLFLCYNKNLKDFLEKERKIDGIDYYTIDGFACKKCKSSTANYYDLNNIVTEEILNDSFEYKHIIVDEGQDFGRSEIDDSHFLDTLAEYANNFDGCSFFIFYDKNQLVNSKQIPSYLTNVDSKLTLYKNCRNTKKIAETAFSLIDVKPVVYDGAMEGEQTRFIYYSSVEELEKRLDNIIEDISKENEFGRVLITCKGMDGNSLKDKIDPKTDCYKSISGKKTRVYSCSTFKGLEEDYVLLFDVDKGVFEKHDLSFYVGASRAKRKLFVFLKLDESKVVSIINDRFSDSFKKTDKRQQLALAMHGTYSK